MNDLELRVKQLESQLSRARLEAEFAYDRENILRNNHDHFFLLFKALSSAQTSEQKYAILIKTLKTIVDFDQVVLLSHSLKKPEDVSLIYSSSPVLSRHNWKYTGEIKNAFLDEIVVLNDPSIASGFESEDLLFAQITRSVILLPLTLQSSELLFVCTHHKPLAFDLFIKRQVKNYQAFFEYAVVSIQYRSDLEDEVKHRTHELIEHQEKLKSFHRLSNEDFWLLDSDLKFKSYAFESVESESIIHNSERYNSVIGKSFIDVLNKEIADNIPGLYDKINNIFANKEEIKDIELPLVAGTSLFWARVNGEPLYNDNGDFAGYIGTVLDITVERKQTYELQRARDAAEIANRSKTEFLAVMSHEIKTPLQAILGMLDLLEQTTLDSTQRSYIKHVSQSASLLQTILQDVLDLSKIESQAMELENIAFDIKFALDSVIIQMREKAEKKGIKLLSTVSSNFPEMIVGDQHRLCQILFNLINNAIKFTENGSIDVTAERYENRLKFQIKDTGTGIPKDLLENLFKPFVQLDSSITRKYGGTGLGLAICKRLVEHMGGKIGIKSILGTGSTFWFEIPCKVPATALIGAKSIRKSTEHIKRIYKILLVEDSQINQFVIKTMLEKLGHTVTLASNGKEAIEVVKNDYPNLILMDLQMPVMDGIEATKHIMTEIAPFPIIALTANFSDEERIMCRKVGMVSMASKPVTTATLKKLLEDLEGVIEDANEKVQEGEKFELSDEGKNTGLTKVDTLKSQVIMGAVSSHGKSNAALIDALVKSNVNSDKSADNQRTRNTD